MTGTVHALEPEFGPVVMLAARGYDLSQGLNRARQDTDVRADDHRRHRLQGRRRSRAQRPGRRLQRVAAAGLLAAERETDLELLWRLARRIGAEVVVIDSDLHLRDAPPADSAIELAWGCETGAGPNALRSFRPRVSGAQQVGKVEVGGWDPQANQAILGEGEVGDLSSSIGLDRASVLDGVSGADSETLRISDRTPASADEAKAMASSALTRIADAYLDAEAQPTGTRHCAQDRP